MGKFNKDSVQILLQLFEKEYGVKPIIYTPESGYCSRLKELKGYKFRLANYRRKPRPRHYIRQISDTNTVPGIEKPRNSSQLLAMTDAAILITYLAN